MPKKVKLPKKGQFIVTTPHRYDKVQSNYGEVEIAHELEGNNKACTDATMQIYWKRWTYRQSALGWTFTTGFKVIPKYAIPGFLAMQEKLAQNPS